MRILVCGGRDYGSKAGEHEKMAEVLNGYEITEIIHGNARGADTIAGDFAASSKIPVRAFPADWKTYGRGAGHVRNKQMLEGKPDLVIAFPGGKGTANMIKQAKAANVEVRNV